LRIRHYGDQFLLQFKRSRLPVLGLWELTVPRFQATVKPSEATKLRLLGASHARDQRAQDPRYVFRPFRISTQPEGIVGYTAWHSPRDTVQLHWFTARAQHAKCIDGAVPEDPCVLAVAAALHRDDGAFRIGNTH